MEKTFSPQVLDADGNRKRRFCALHAATKVQKRQLAAEIMDIGLAELERRIKKATAIA